MYFFPQEAYSHVALFFYDEHGGDVIGVVWNPKALSAQELKVQVLCLGC